MPRPGRPTANIDKAVELYESSDLGYQCIADDLNVPKRLLIARLTERGTFRDQRTANNLAMQRGQGTRLAARDFPEDFICSAYADGASENELAKMHDCSRVVIKRILERHGIPRRDNANANRLMMAGRTPEENARNAQAAHDAARGSVRSWEQRCELAARRHGTVPALATELLYAAWLRMRGFEIVHQHAVGPYNCDLTIPAACVAVEIFGGNWHGTGKHAGMFAERAQYVLDQGWLLVVVWVDQAKKRLSEASADYIGALAEQARRDPSLRGQYRVVWGDGEVVPTEGRQLDEFATVPAHRSRAKRR
jgi:very-short-patch-repair endonuclease